MSTIGIVVENFGEVDVLSISTNSFTNDWVLDFSCSYHCVRIETGFPPTSQSRMELLLWEIIFSIR